jgi:hypothetical protein
MSRLRVLLDGAELGEEEARALWQRFSAWMDRHHGDLAGFARGEGLASIHPEVHGGAPVLVASRTEAQRDYTSAPKRTGGDAGRPAGRPAGRVTAAPGSGSRPTQREGAHMRKSRRKAR